MEPCLTDMHIHSTASDGTDDVRELLAKVQKAGIRVFSLTDHDTIKGALLWSAWFRKICFSSRGSSFPALQG